MPILRYALLALLCACLSALPAVPASAQHAPASVEVVFDPPLDATQRFRLTITKKGRTVSWVEELRFARDGDGFLAYWRMDPQSLPPELMHPLMLPLTDPFTREPTAFELDAKGSLLRVRDWHIVKPRLLKTVADSRPAVEARGVTGAADMDKVLAGVIAMFDGLTAETAPDILLKYLGPVMGAGGIAMEVGETREDDVEIPAALFGISVVQKVRISLTAVDPGRSATVVAGSELDQEGFRKLMAGMIDRFRHAHPAKMAELERQVAEMQRLNMTDAMTMVIDLPTGLVSRYDSRRTARADAETMVETHKIEWLR